MASKAPHAGLDDEGLLVDVSALFLNVFTQLASSQSDKHAEAATISRREVPLELLFVGIHFVAGADALLGRVDAHTAAAQLAFRLYAQVILAMFLM